MKKSLFLIIIVAVLLWSCSTAFCKGSSKGAGGKAEGPAKPVKQPAKTTVQENRKSRQSDPNQLKAPGKADKSRLREQFRQPPAKQKAATDINQPTGKSGKAKPKSTVDVNQLSKLGKPKLKDLVPEIEKTPGHGQLHQQQLQSLQTQLIHEQAKHNSRLARLNRIRLLAAETADTKTVERVDKLLQMENQRFSREQQLMQERQQKVLQLGEKSPIQETLKVAGPKGKGADEKKPGKDKPEDVNKPPAKKS